jgi:Protein of unknown function (DUF3515)
VHGRPRLTPGAWALAVLTLAIAGCSRGPQPAPGADDPACSRALAAAPATVLGKTRTPLDVRGALAWGDPQIVLRCGVPALGPTTAQCLEVNGVDWVVADPGADPVVFTLFGRSPAVDLSVPASYGQSTASAALVDVAAVARALPANGRACS